MSEEKALQLGFKPKAYLRTWTYAGVDPFEGAYCDTGLTICVLDSGCEVV
jgi:acetyl-CoA acetyltransferase